jgi:hypothetical protein
MRKRVVSICLRFRILVGLMMVLTLVNVGSAQEAGVPLVLNEFMASNSATIQDDFGEYEDWIELHNIGNAPVNLDGMYLTDNVNDATQWRIAGADPGQMIIPAGGYLVIWADNDSDQGPYHAPFKLSAAGERIGLYDRAGRLIDTVQFGVQLQDVAMARVNGQWQMTEHPSPGRANPGGGAPVLITEIMYNPSIEGQIPENPAAEFIEIHNQGILSVDMSGWGFVRGIRFQFPQQTSLAAGDYLVVAADVGVFRQRYPNVDLVVGYWEGRLSNSGETLELVDAQGQTVDTLPYADQGDWAQRVLGPRDSGHRGWAWQAEHDGQGHSLELVALEGPNQYGQNWRASRIEGGTPGQANSVSQPALIPMVVDVSHSPPVPTSQDWVRVGASLVGTTRLDVDVTLCYRPDTSAYTGEGDYPVYDADTFTRLPMHDNGALGDDRAFDRRYHALIPAHVHDTVVEFFVEVCDNDGVCRTWPTPGVIDTMPAQVVNALYLVQDADAAPAPGPTHQPTYHVIMTRSERGRLADIGDSEGGEHNSNAKMNASFVSVGQGKPQVRYCVGVRNRGHGSRRRQPNNMRVDLPHDQPWESVRSLNLNTQYTFTQVAGSALGRLAGLPCAEVTPVQVRINGDNLARSGSSMYGAYAHVEVIDSDFVQRYFPQDEGGNLYKCMRSNGPEANLTYQGNRADPYRPSYLKRTNKALDDFSDVIDLTYVMTESSDAAYLSDVERVADVDQWLRYLALNALLNNTETSLGNGVGDDYYFYRGVTDPRFVLIPHDFDSILRGDTRASIFRSMNLSSIARLLNVPAHASRYYYHLQDLIRTTLASGHIETVLNHLLGDYVPESAIQSMVNFQAARNDYVLSRIQGELTVRTDLPLSNGYYVADTDNVILRGTADPIRTQSVWVNDLAAQWSPLDAQWSLSAVTRAHGAGIRLQPGYNRLEVLTFDGPDGTGNELARARLGVWYGFNHPNPLGGDLTADTVLYPDAGLWLINQSLTVLDGITLTIEPGTIVYFQEGTGMTVAAGGRLIAEGTPYRPIHLAHPPTLAWNGIRFDHSLEDNRLRYVDFEFGNGSGTALTVESARVQLDHVTWPRTDARILEFRHPRAVIRNCVIPAVSGTEPVHGSGLSGEEYLIFDGCVFGTTTGYNDIIDFTGAHRPGPVLQLYNSVFLGGGDDGVDVDSTDAHIEGNTFMNFASGPGSTGTSNAVATGQEGGDASVIYLARNTFVNNDYAVLLKEGSQLIAQHNTFVNSAVAAISFGEPFRNPPRAPGQGALLEGNILWNNTAPFEYYFQNPPDYGPDYLSVHHSLLPGAWLDLGYANIDADPLFVDEHSDFRLRHGSNALGTGPGGSTMGASAAGGAVISGVPGERTHHRSVTLAIGGAGIVAYRYSLNEPDGPFSAEMPVETPLALDGLREGRTYVVYVQGKNSAGVWQDTSTASQAWTIDSRYAKLVINEVLVRHTQPPINGGFAALVELYYDGPTALDLSGYSLSTDPNTPGQYLMGSGVRIQPQTFYTLAQGPDLDPNGGELTLFDRENRPIDSVRFGHQLVDLSLGRFGPQGIWRLCRPTLGAANEMEPTGDPERVRLNEWLANPEPPFASDFIELYNPSPWPVNVGDYTLTDAPIGQPAKFRLSPATFIGARGFLVLSADGQSDAGHVDFSLSARGEMLALLDPNLTEIDSLVFRAQLPNISTGRAPNGADQLEDFDNPTPGTSNPFDSSVIVTEAQSLVPMNQTWAYNQMDLLLGSNWMQPGYNDTNWARGPALLYVESSGLPAEKRTPLTLGADTYYFRSLFRMNAGADISALALYTIVDDGAIVYLNGNEILRLNMPDGAVQHSTRTNSSVGNATLEGPFEIPADYLVPGTNTLAAEVHQSSGSSSDIVFGLQLDALTQIRYN